MAVYSAIKDEPFLTVHVLNARMKEEADYSYFMGASVSTVNKGEDIADKVREAAESKGIDLIVPTKDPLIRLCAKLSRDMDGKFFLPDSEIIAMLQDKSSTYRLFSRSNIPTPIHYEAHPRNAENIQSLLARAGSVFQKPRTGSGGQNVKRVRQLEEIYWSADYIVCETLAMPEYNQTFVVRDETIHGGITYKSNRQGYTPTSRVEQVPDLLEGEKVMRVLMGTFGLARTNGIYNLDFMRRSDGRLALNEVNPGRFPAGAYPLREKFKDLILIAFG